jgi:hypothetical protein
METPYMKLPKEERKSDVEQATEILEVLGRVRSDTVAALKEQPPVMEHVTDEVPYRENPVREETVTEVDIEGLEDNVAGIFLLNWARPEHLYEVYGNDMAKVPDYVPAGSRKKWASMWDALYREYGDESRAFAITNAKYVEKKG